MGCVPSPMDDALHRLGSELAKLDRELEWLEFKVGNEDAVGEYISAIANSAALVGRPRGFVIWGITDDTHEVVGTGFDPLVKKVGNEDFLNWLTRGLTPQIHFEFRITSSADARPRLVILEIEAASNRPIAFKGVEYIRVGSHKKRLVEHPDHERRLWKAFESRVFETGIAVEGLGADEVTSLLDYPSYFRLMDTPLPESRSGIVEALLSDRLVSERDDGLYDITNLGGILFANNLGDFPGLKRKAPRVIVYRGNSRVETVREQEGVLGYAAGFKRLIRYINDLLPTNEIIGQALRTTARLYPELAIRELVANALVHQDFTLAGTGPTIELFDDRLEITNPGKSLIPPERFIDKPPISRNEALAAMMRRAGICEERGSGWDKIALEVELHQLPAPSVSDTGEHLQAVLFAPRPLKELDREGRIRAMYLHACLKWVQRAAMTNTTVRERFGIEKRNTAQASRLIKESLDAGLIVPYDAAAGAKAMRYLPYWTQSPTDT